MNRHFLSCEIFFVDFSVKFTFHQLTVCSCRRRSLSSHAESAHYSFWISRLIKTSRIVFIFADLLCCSLLAMKLLSRVLFTTFSPQTHHTMLAALAVSVSLLICSQFQCRAKHACGDFQVSIFDESVTFFYEFN